MLIQLTYASRCSRVLGPSDVKEILQTSQRNNSAVGITGALCLANGIFLQQLEGDRDVVNKVYLRILRDSRHKEPAILDFSEIAARRFGNWNMGLISSVAENRQIFLKYSRTIEFDPYSMSTLSLRGFFEEIVQGGVRWIG
jgi:hypothetical protein